MTTIHHALPFVLVEEQNPRRVGIWYVSGFGMSRIWEREGVTLSAASINYNTWAVASIVSPPSVFIYGNGDLYSQPIDLPSPLAGVGVFAFSTPLILYSRSYPAPRLYMHNPITRAEQHLGEDIIHGPVLTVVRNNRAVSRFVSRAEDGVGIVWRAVGPEGISPSVSGIVCNLAARVPQYCRTDGKTMKIIAIESGIELAEIRMKDDLTAADPVWGTVERDRAILCLRVGWLTPPLYAVVALWGEQIVWVKITESYPSGAFVDANRYCVACGNAIYRVDGEGKAQAFVARGNRWDGMDEKGEEMPSNILLAFSIKWHQESEYTILT